MVPFLDIEIQKTRRSETDDRSHLAFMSSPPYMYIQIRSPRRDLRIFNYGPQRRQLYSH
jgi:hypothetical protein